MRILGRGSIRHCERPAGAKQSCRSARRDCFVVAGAPSGNDNFIDSSVAIFKPAHYRILIFLVLSLGRTTVAAAQQLRDVKPPLEMPFGGKWMLWALPVLALIAISWLIRRWRKGRLQKPQRPPDPPWTIARRELEQLQKDDLPSQGRAKEYYVRLSDIVRHYLEGRFGIQAPEMTTEEFLEHLKHTAILNELQKTFLQDFLTQSDMVKFAKRAATAAEMQQSFELAGQLIDETKPSAPASRSG